MKDEKNIVVKIKTTNLDFTPALKDYVNKKIASLEKFLKHYSDQSGELIFDVEIGKTTMHHKSGNVFRAEMNFTAGSVHLRSEAEKEDLYAAIDEAKDEMKRTLRRKKSRQIDFIKRGGARMKDFVRGFPSFDIKRFYKRGK